MKDNPEKVQSQAKQDANIDDLTDIRDVTIDTSLSMEERKRSYQEQIRDPNLFRYGNTIVRSTFQTTGPTLKDRLQQYLQSGASSWLFDDK